jgi:hypothetical protein
MLSRKPRTVAASNCRSTTGFGAARTGVAVVAQPVDDRVEPRRVGKRAVHEHDRRLGGRRAGVAVAAKANEARETLASATVASAPRRWRRERMGMVLVLLFS